MLIGRQNVRCVRRCGPDSREGGFRPEVLIHVSREPGKRLKADNNEPWNLQAFSESPEGEASPWERNNGRISA
jgi:hypothetical protein